MTLKVSDWQLESDLDSICISCDVLFPLKLVRNFPTKLFCINKGLFLSKFPSIADYPDCSPVLPSSYQKNKTNISLVQGEIFKISTLISRFSISLLSRETTLKKSLETACAQSPKEDFGTSLKIRTIPALQRSTCSFANNRVRKNLSERIFVVFRIVEAFQMSACVQIKVLHCQIFILHTSLAHPVYSRNKIYLLKNPWFFADTLNFCRWLQWCLVCLW